MSRLQYGVKRRTILPPWPPLPILRRPIRTLGGEGGKVSLPRRFDPGGSSTSQAGTGFAESVASGAG